MEVGFPEDQLVRRLRRLGYVLTGGVGLVAALLIAYGMVSEVPIAGLVLPIAAAVALVAASLRLSSTTAFVLIGAGSAILLIGDRGVSVLEVLYGVGAMAYLGAWVLYAMAARAGVLRSSTDLAVAAWCVFGIAGGAALGVLFGGDPYDFRADVQAALFLPFYFPVKETIRRSPHGPLLVLGLFVGLGLFAAVYNTISLRSQLAQATAIYEVVDVRVPGGMMQVSAAVLMVLSTLAVRQRRWVQIGLLAALALLLIGLVTGKSRAYWVAVALGVGVVWVLSKGKDRQRLAVFLVAGIAGVIALALVVVGDQLLLIAAGALDRLTSLVGSGSDISLVNRFVESQAALERIAANPILGHGWGTQITYYSIVSYGTTSWAYMHNGYIAIWFKLGLWGLGLMVFAWVASIVQGAWAAWLRSLEPTERALLVGSVATLCVFAITAVTSNPFSVMDQMLAVAFLLGAVNGVIQRRAPGLP